MSYVGTKPGATVPPAAGMVKSDGVVLQTAVPNTDYLPAANPTFTGDLTAGGVGQRIKGDFSNATMGNRAMFQTVTVNGETVVSAIPNGSATGSIYEVVNSSDLVNHSVGHLGANATDIRLQSTKRGSSAYLPMTFYTGGAERMRIDINGQLGLGVVPSAWSPNWKAFQNGYGAMHWNTPNLSFTMSNNVYINATPQAKRISSGYALDYYQIISSGQHVWRTAANAAGDTDISWAESMKLDASGNLTVAGTVSGGSGSVIGMHIEANAGSAGITSASLANTTTSAINYSTKSTNSKLLVRVDYDVNTPAAAGLNCQSAQHIYEITNGGLFQGTQTTVGVVSGAGGVAGSWRVSLSAVVNNSAVGLRQFVLYGNNGNPAAGSVDLINQVWSITEIKV